MTLAFMPKWDLHKTHAMYLSLAGVYFNSTSHNVREFVVRRTGVEVIVVQYKSYKTIT